MLLQLRLVSFILLMNFNYCYCGESKRMFPEHFKFGAATASYQVEGGWDADGKGESIWDHITHTRPDFIIDNANGDIACDSYHLYKKDVAMVKQLGLDFYRFSISWPRILPSGFSNEINYEGVFYYNNLIDELIANGITPLVTLYHWDLPQALQLLGGWTNPRMADYFEDYAKVVFEMFGDRVRDWITFNEPSLVCLEGYGKGNVAPGLNMAGIAEYLCVHTLLLAHARAYHMYDDDFRLLQKGRISLTLSAQWLEPADNSPRNEAAAQKAREFDVGWYANPIFSKAGDYPSVVKDTIANRSVEQGYRSSRLPRFTAEEVEYVRGTYDFIGVNHYTTRMVRAPTEDLGNAHPSYDDDLNVEQFTEEHWPRAESFWLYEVPWGFRKMLNWIKDTYNNPEILVLENGFSDTPGTMNDTGRIDFYRGYLNALLDAIDDGCNVTAYAAWSLMDNFEWTLGYTARFGLYHVDFESPSRTRTPKESAEYYKTIVKNRCL